MPLRVVERLASNQGNESLGLHVAKGVDQARNAVVLISVSVSIIAPQ